jgi:flagellar hook-associated protein 2
MAIASLSGINSGLDSSGIVNNLVALEARPIDLLISQQETEKDKLAAFQDLQSRLQTFKSVVNTINTESRFLSSQGEFSNNDPSSNNTVVDITTANTATSGTFSLSVNQLARETKIISQGFATTTSEITSGRVEIFDGTKTTFIDIDSSNNTVDGLRLAINNSGANVSASFLNDGDPNSPIRLLISGTKTGEDNAVTISHKFGSIGGDDIVLTDFTETQSAQNAELVIDGVSISKNSNLVNDVITGTTLSLQSTGTGTINISTNINNISDKVSSFVDGFNELMLYLNEQLAVDVSKGNTGTLFGNFTVQNLQQNMRSSITSLVSGVSGSFKYLSQIGISTNKDSTISLDKSVLTSAIIQDPQNVSQLFSSKGTTSNTGVTFVGFTSKTKAETYDVRVRSGVPQLSKSGTNNYTNATGTGNFFAGASGTDAEGLNFRISNLADGDYGSVTLSIGVAEILNRTLNSLVDTSQGGPLATEIDTVEETISNLEDTINVQEGRLTLFEQDLQRKFTNLEIVVGRLNSQRDTFSQAIAGIQNLFKK